MKTRRPVKNVKTAVIVTLLHGCKLVIKYGRDGEYSRYYHKAKYAERAQKFLMRNAA